MIVEGVYILIAFGLSIISVIWFFIEEEVIIVLGSSSSARKYILDKAQIEYTFISPEIDEQLISYETPKQYVLDVAKAKAEALKPIFKGVKCILVTADQIVVGSGVFEKPKNRSEAKRFLKSYSNSTVSTITGLVVVNMKNGFTTRQTDISTIEFDEITDKDIDQILNPDYPIDVWEKTNNYLFLPGFIPLAKKIKEESRDKVNVFDCCGALAIEHPSLYKRVKRVTGSYSSILGLSLPLMIELIEEVK